MDRNKGDGRPHFVLQARPSFVKDDPIGEPWELDITPEFGLDTLLLESETGQNRLIFRTSTFPEAQQHPGSSFGGELFYQKKGPNDDWTDPSEAFTPRDLRRGECIKLRLRATHLKMIFQALARRYNELDGVQNLLQEVGIRTFDPSDATLVTGHSRDLLATMVQSNPSFWSHLAELKDCEMPSVILNEQTKQKQQAALDQFEQHMEKEDWSELDWGRYFKHNEWIFGLGLSYVYLKDVQEQAYVGGTGTDGRGGNLLDFLRRTDGEHSYTSFVEIKKPETELVGRAPYRQPNIYRIASEIAGGVSQLQHYCDSFSTQMGSRGDVEGDIGAENYHPKALLVVGRLSQLDTRHKRRSFELFRRQVTNPEIITFDELLARARYIVNHDGFAGGPVDESNDDGMNDVPF